MLVDGVSAGAKVLESLVPESSSALHGSLLRFLALNPDPGTENLIWQQLQSERCVLHRSCKRDVEAVRERFPVSAVKTCSL